MFKKIFIANRGEIALRLVRAARDMGVASVAVYAQDDALAPHVHSADEALALGQTGPQAYLDIAHLIALAQQAGCDAVHPGYGFLSERADFAQACADAGLVFIGPSPQHLALFGDKAAARELAQLHGVPLMPGSPGAVTLAQAQDFFALHPDGIVIKAIGGGGGRGMRAVLAANDLPEAYARCVSEARAAFGVDGVYVERLMVQARHIEIQVIGDGNVAMSLGERECSFQRRFQKLIEIAPSPSLPQTLREQITQAALTLAQAVGYRSLGTFEFLVDERSSEVPFVFIEANARLQVEHTVTEAVTGLDLVQLQIAVAAGANLAALGLDPLRPPQSRGFAVQWRVNAETMDAQGQTRPGSGTLTRFDIPSGPGVRVDTHGFNGASPSPHYDSLLAKVVVHSGSPVFADVVRRGQRALQEFCIEGIRCNLDFLQALTAHPAFVPQAVHTRFVDEHRAELLTAALVFSKSVSHQNASVFVANNPIDAWGNDPFNAEDTAHTASGQVALPAPMAARLVQLDVAVGDVVAPGSQIAVLEAMKMEHLMLATSAGRVVAVKAVVGSYLAQDQPLIWLEPLDLDAVQTKAGRAADPNLIRADLQKVLDRTAFTLDANRPHAIERRRKTGGRTARENIADLCDLASDPGNFIEYGAFAIAAQTRRRAMDDLIANTPADGMITGIGSINAGKFGAKESRCVVMAYDFTVLAGTQGKRNHQKTDRLLGVALQQKLPVVLFAEGGGGRPGDVDTASVAGLHTHTFSSFARLNGQVPVVGIVAGRCFAGNASLLGCADVIIATQDSNIGMGGPAMVEGGGLGVFKPEQIGPSDVQHANGVIDILVNDEAQAVAAAKHYLSFFQGATGDGAQAAVAPESVLLRHVVPENRLRVYDTCAAITGVVDEGSALFLRTGFGKGIHTALGRIEGRPVGLIANNPHHLGGAIDADAADKCARFMQLCNAHGLPLVSFVDTPGFMVGPDIEELAQVRHVSRMFVAAAHLRVPLFAVVLRKGYGLGAMAMTAGGFLAPVFTISWPTGEFGGMGLEGAVRLGYRKELEAVPQGPERDALYQSLVAKQYENGSAINMATMLEIDAVIDPAHTRDWLLRGLQSSRVEAPSGVMMIDAW